MKQKRMTSTQVPLQDFCDKEQQQQHNKDKSGCKQTERKLVIHWAYKVEGNVKTGTELHPVKCELSPERYTVCSRDGDIEGTFSRQEIHYQKLFTSRLWPSMQTKLFPKKGFSVANASALYNVHGAQKSCQCKSASMEDTRCTCHPRPCVLHF